jgi:hypothetical protein
MFAKSKDVMGNYWDRHIRLNEQMKQSISTASPFDSNCLFSVSHSKSNLEYKPLTITKMKQSLLLLSLGSLACASVSWCPGALMTGSNPDVNVCCVGATIPGISHCPGWPICGSEPTATARDDNSAPVSRVTCIPTTASDYYELASSVSSAYLDDQGSITATASSSSEPTEGISG